MLSAMPHGPGAFLRVVVFRGALVASALGTAAAGAAAEPPAGTAPSEGTPTSATPKTIDEFLASVEGDVITRRRIVREIGPMEEGEEPAQYERKVYLRLLDRARVSVIVKAAQRMGLTVQPDQLDDYVAKRAKDRVDAARARAEKAQPGSGASITFEKLLLESGQTLEDFRAERSDELMIRNYWSIMVHGVPGKRPLFDMEPSPQEIRRLYDAHRSRFDDNPAVRFVRFVALPTNYLLVEGGRTYDQALEAAKADLAAAVEEVRAGASAASIAKKRGFKRPTEIGPGEWVEAGAPAFQMKDAKGMEEWLFDPARKVGDSTVFSSDDPAAVLLTAQRPARTRTFEEAKADVSDLIRKVRGARFEITHRLELLGRASVRPQRIMEDLLAQERERLAHLDKDEMLRDIRLR
jgi:hypothetical protein